MKTTPLVDISALSDEEKITNVVIFILGVVPFSIAAYQFWTRIAYGQTFGTGDDPVVFPNPDDSDVLVIKEVKSGKEGRKPKIIGKKGEISIGMDPDTNRGRRVLGTDALVCAYFLMFLAGLSVLLGWGVAWPALMGQVPTPVAVL